VATTSDGQNKQIADFKYLRYDKATMEAEFLKPEKGQAQNKQAGDAAFEAYTAQLYDPHTNGQIEGQQAAMQKMKQAAAEIADRQMKMARDDQINRMGMEERV
jgi:hypothetical protein